MGSTSLLGFSCPNLFLVLLIVFFQEPVKRIRLQIAYRSVDRCQDRMLGWAFIFALWDTCSGYQYYCSGKPHLVQVIFVLYPILLYVKSVNAAASRASSSHLK